MRIFEILLSVIDSCLRNIGGGAGIRLRYLYYRHRFKKCGKNIRIDVGVIFENPGNISVGNNVLFLPYSIITARAPGRSIDGRVMISKPNSLYRHRAGEVVIGNEVGIGAYNIIQGFGGLEIADKVTTSARVSIYSLSHYPYDPEDRSKITYANAMVQGGTIVCIDAPVVIEEGVWLGIGVSVFGGTVSKNTFVAANSVVINGLPENSYAKGNPAARVGDRFNLQSNR